MALGKKTGGRDFGPGQGGRKKGSKDKIPRSVKASIATIYEEIASDTPEIIRDAIVRGLKAPPPKSFPYVNLGALYLDGKPTERSDASADLASSPLGDKSDLTLLLADLDAAYARAQELGDPREKLRPAPTGQIIDAQATDAAPQIPARRKIEKFPVP